MLKYNALHTVHSKAAKHYNFLRGTVKRMHAKTRRNTSVNFSHKVEQAHISSCRQPVVKTLTRWMCSPCSNVVVRIVILFSLNFVRNLKTNSEYKTAKDCSLVFSLLVSAKLTQTSTYSRNSCQIYFFSDSPTQSLTSTSKKRNYIIITLFSDDVHDRKAVTLNVPQRIPYLNLSRSTVVTRDRTNYDY